MTLGYLATPYSRYPRGLEAAFMDAAELCARLMQIGVHCYSPIAHTHPVAMYGHIDPLNHAIWLPFDEQIMERCDVLIVAHMDGWQESKGIAHEIKFFEQMGKPIFDLVDLESLQMKRRMVAVDHAVKEVVVG